MRLRVVMEVECPFTCDDQAICTACLEAHKKDQKGLVHILNPEIIQVCRIG